MMSTFTSILERELDKERLAVVRCPLCVHVFALTSFRCQPAFAMPSLSTLPLERCMHGSILPTSPTHIMP